MASQRTLDLLAKKAKKEKEAVKNKTEKTVEEIIVKKVEGNKITNFDAE